jgi:hypothetical protein
MSPEIASTWLKLTGKKRSREFSHSLDPLPPVANGSFAIRQLRLQNQISQCAQHLQFRDSRNLAKQRARTGRI